MLSYNGNFVPVPMNQGEQENVLLLFCVSCAILLSTYSVLNMTNEYQIQ